MAVLLKGRRRLPLLGKGGYMNNVKIITGVH